ncbi:hypothetical protein J4N45_07310 [Vibrio sp. SCSIO 43140]|uniref:hypothetical protein n=1 Tax=Vibrio sp. SCSIO 43140 TaxID=2819100 RepID=UPI002075E57C|nr:hypothetical protein [Vibrio sp. SCSIO 43140]USD61759.1 hypothetical protein J4N45_07310 [Vibrio sp. SCSIO 43140]
MRTSLSLYLGLSLLLLVLLVSGCTTERYFNGNGAETIVYQEVHRVDYVIKKRDATLANMKQFIALSESSDKEANYVVSYKSKSAKNLAEQAFSKFDALTISPSRVQYHQDMSGVADISIIVAVHKIKTQTCQPAQVQQEIGQPDCFVETMRLKQVAYKSRLVGDK